MKKILLVIIMVLPSIIGFGQIDRVSVHKKSQVLKEGKKQTITADCYYEPKSEIFVMHYISPKEFIKNTNRHGEMKVYFPKENKVSIYQDFYFSSHNELLHYFVNNLTEDLGLENEGFRMKSSRQEENYLVTTWQAPEEMNTIEKVEMVYENMLPVYSAYFNKKNDVIKKIYYSDYYIGNSFVLPKKITEISFTSKKDSTIKRTIFSDIKKNEEVNPYYLDFEIPQDAKILK